MKQDNTLSVWRTMFTGTFDINKYLYHYTSIDKALKILDSNYLLFSPISSTNDTSESKVKIDFCQNYNMTTKEFKEKSNKVVDYFYNKHSHIRLLCFSVDMDIDKKIIRDSNSYFNKRNRSEYKYFNAYGRGYALPRMWAQYASNHSGVCFIMNKEKLLNIVEETVAVSKCEKVRYKKFYENYYLSEKELNSIYKKISASANGNLIFMNMIKNNEKFINHCYFEKYEDWEDEHEFRIIAAVDQKDENLKLEDISSCIEGIVVGEKMPSYYRAIITDMIKNNGCTAKIRKIIFDSNICHISEK